MHAVLITTESDTKYIKIHKFIDSLRGTKKLIAETFYKFPRSVHYSTVNSRQTPV